MIDQIVGQLAGPERVTREHFLQWKNDPVTKALYRALVIGALETFDTDLPLDGTGMPMAYHREGAYKMVREVFLWEPEFVNDEDEQ